MTEKGLAINRIAYITLFCRTEKTDWDLHIVECSIFMQYLLPTVYQDDSVQSEQIHVTISCKVKGIF